MSFEVAVNLPETNFEEAEQGTSVSNLDEFDFNFEFKLEVRVEFSTWKASQDYSIY
jgi:hypothetical protein